MIIVVYGGVATGKTSIGKALKERLDEPGRSFNIIHSDDFSKNTYQQMYRKVSEGIENGKDDWILDGTFYKGEWRAMFDDVDDTYFVEVSCSLESSTERNQKREGSLPEKVIHIIRNEYEEGEPDIVIDTDEKSPGDAVGQIIESLGDQLKE